MWRQCRSLTAIGLYTPLRSLQLWEQQGLHGLTWRMYSPLVLDRAADNQAMTLHAAPWIRWTLAGTMALAVTACSEPPKVDWKEVEMADAGLNMAFPCDADVAQQKVDFGLGNGPVVVNMMGCDAVDSTYAMSHWVLDDAKQADDALAFWQAAVLTKLEAVDGNASGEKSGSQFVPSGAMPLPRSIRATVQGVGPSGWTITTHGVWFARKEAGDKARIYHAVVYSPKPQHEQASDFFQRIKLQLAQQ